MFLMLCLFFPDRGLEIAKGVLTIATLVAFVAAFGLNVSFYYGGGLYPTTSPKWRRAARALVHAPHSLRESPPPHPPPPTSFIKSSTSSTSHHMSEHESVRSPVCFGGAGVPREAKCFKC
jgi:hypothetical protein